MKDDAFAIFLYDLIILGRRTIEIDDIFIDNLYDFLKERINEYKNAILAIAISNLKHSNFTLYFYADDISSSIDKVETLLAHKKDCNKVFSSLDNDTLNEIGNLAIGFNTYLSMKEELTINYSSFSYKYLKN